MKQKRNWFKITLGLCVALLGIAIAVFGNMGKNSAIIVFGALILIAGGMYTKHSYSQTEYQNLKNKSAKPPNSLNIYPDKVLFEYVDNPLGYEHRYRNTNESFYIQVYKNGEWQPLTLPDPETGITPEEVADPAEGKPIKEYLAYEPTTAMKMVTAGILGVIIGGELIAMVAMVGS